MGFLKNIQVRSSQHDQMLDITNSIAEQIPDGFNGACVIYTMHTTAGITVNENADPDVASDIIGQLERMIPWNSPHYQHNEGNSAAHVKASLLGNSVTIPVIDGQLRLGTWQGIYFCEFDGPRQRKVAVQVLPAQEIAQ